MHDLAARLGTRRIVGGKRSEIAAPHLLVQLGELARNRGLAGAEARREIGERRGKSRPALEQHQRCRDAGKLADACAPCCFLCGQESLEEEPVGRQSRDRQRHQRR